MSEPVQRFVIETALFLLGLLISFGLPWMVWRWLGSRRPSATPAPIVDDGDGGNVIPLIATFCGVRGLTWIGLASNSLNPRLVITPYGITYRVMGLRTRSWADIEYVDVRTLGATVNLNFAFHGSPFTFDANVGSITMAAQTLSLLPDHVVLTDRARTILSSTG